MYKPIFNRRKFRNLILFLAHLSQDDPYFGAVKLNKLLYYADFQAFARLGRPITDATYQKLQEGPAPRELLQEREAMVDEGEAELKTTQFFSFTQHRLVPKSDCESLAEDFSTAELSIIREVHRAMLPMTARQASDLSHGEIGWKVARFGEAIPYETAYLVSDYDEEVAAAVANADTLR